MTGEPDDALIGKQHLVQRKLGRCMLILQQYEHLLKAIAATHSVAGPVDQIDQIREKQAADVQRKTMGQLVGTMIDAYIVDSSTATEGHEDGLSIASSDGQDWIASSFRISFSPERYAKERDDIERIVTMRNELVHHFIEKFDLWGEQGCAEAEVHLDECYAGIRSSFFRLRQFAQSTDTHRARTREFLLSQEGCDFIVDGILPDGRGVDWPRSTIVELLREAETKFAQDGWTPLASAIKWIASTVEEQTPKKYGCASWRQVVHETKLFDVRRGNEGGATAPGSPIWYRSRRL